MKLNPVLYQNINRSEPLKIMKNITLKETLKAAQSDYVNVPLIQSSLVNRRETQSRAINNIRRLAKTPGPLNFNNHLELDHYRT